MGLAFYSFCVCSSQHGAGNKRMSLHPFPSTLVPPSATCSAKSVCISRLLSKPLRLDPRTLVFCLHLGHVLHVAEVPTVTSATSFQTHDLNRKSHVIRYASYDGGDRAKRAREITSARPLPLLFLARRELESARGQQPRPLPLPSWRGTRSDPTSGPSPGSSEHPEIHSAATCAGRWWQPSGRDDLQEAVTLLLCTSLRQQALPTTQHRPRTHASMSSWSALFLWGGWDTQVSRDHALPPRTPAALRRQHHLAGVRSSAQVPRRPGWRGNGSPGPP